MQKEQKAFPVMVLKVEAQGIVEAIVAVCGNIDYGDDVIEPGAFTKTISERGTSVKVLDQHNTHSVLNAIGKNLTLREVSRNDLPTELLAKYPDAKGGLYTKTQYLLNTPEGLGAFIRIQEGAIDQYSIGFEAYDVTYKKVKNSEGKEVVVRSIGTVSLWEYSPVIFAMNAATTTVAVKSGDAPAPEENPADKKEMTPDGPQVRLGDYLKACVFDTYMMLCNNAFEQGYTSDAEHRMMCETGLKLLDTMGAGISEDIAMRPYSKYGYDDYFMWRRPDAFDSKAGRVLSATNEAELRAALAKIESVLAAAAPAESSSDDEPTEAGPPADDKADTPTFEDTKARLLKAIEFDLEELETLTGV